MSREFVLVLIFIAATLIGYRLIKAVPSLLHTPLMSGMNALSGVTVLGCMMALHPEFDLGSTIVLVDLSLVSRVIGIVGIACATINVVAGFAVTDRMLNMFHGSKKGEGKQ